MASNRKQANLLRFGFKDRQEGETYSSVGEITTPDGDNSLDLEGSSNDEE